jgi:hypothetical protein
MPFDRLEDITSDDLKSLVGTSPEHKQREYKRNLPTTGSDSRKEFIADVSAFANTDGGDIFFGIGEDGETDMAQSLDGIPLADVAKQISTLENVVRDSIRPRLPRIAFHTVNLNDERGVLVIRIGASHIKPHQSTLDHRFYARNSKGKYILDASELGDVFSRRELLPVSMRRFRRERVDLIASSPEDMPSPVEAAAKLILHYLPEQSFGRFGLVDVGKLNDPAVRNRITAVPVANISGLSFRPNIDGFMYMNGRPDATLQWYVQIFNDGSMEFVNNGAFLNPSSGALVFHPNWVEELLFQSFGFSGQVFKALDIEGRVSIFMSAVGVREHSLTLGAHNLAGLALAATGHETKIGRDPALFNEITVDDMHADSRLAVRPLADQLSRAAGLSRAFSYDENGNYTGYEPW